MALNLVRNSKVFFTTNVDSTTGTIKQASATAFSSSNTFEIQVLDGFTFSQNVNSETVTISEASETPVRGQRAFNTSLAPVDFSFSTYIRPKNASTKITAEESVLWNALMCAADVGTPTTIGSVTGVAIANTGVLTISGTAITGTLPTVGDVVVISGVTSSSPSGQDKYMNAAGKVLTSTAAGITIQMINHGAASATGAISGGNIKYSKFAWNESNGSYSQVTAALSEKNQLQKFGMLFLVDNVLYAVDNCALNQVTIDFGLDQIATAQWTGQATALREFGTGIGANGGSFSGGASGNVGTGGYTQKVIDAQYITNKLSTITLKAVKAIGTSISAGDNYNIPITGGSFTINNNITYITPANLGVVNSPVVYYTGTRAISGNITAYLRTGTSLESGDLLKDMLAEAASNIEPMFALTMSVGGAANAVHVDLEMPSVVLAVPTVDVQQVVSTNIAFTAQGYNASATAANNTFDITNPSDLMVRYYA